MCKYEIHVTRGILLYLLRIFDEHFLGILRIFYREYFSLPITNKLLETHFYKIVMKIVREMIRGIFLFIKVKYGTCVMKKSIF